MPPRIEFNFQPSLMEIRSPLEHQLADDLPGELFPLPEAQLLEIDEDTIPPLLTPMPLRTPLDTPVDLPAENADFAARLRNALERAFAFPFQRIDIQPADHYLSLQMAALFAPFHEIDVDASGAFSLVQSQQLVLENLSRTAFAYQQPSQPVEWSTRIGYRQIEVPMRYVPDSNPSLQIGNALTRQNSCWARFQNGFEVAANLPRQLWRQIEGVVRAAERVLR